MRCEKCGGFDSFIQYYYVDRNGEIFNQSELDAFNILHPYAKVTFEKVLLCGLCYFDLQQQKGLTWQR